MRRKLLSLALFFISAPFILLGVILFCLSYTHEQRGFNATNFNFSQKYIKFQALPEDLNIATITDFEPVDVRVERLREFMGQYNSPLTDYAQIMVKTADEYDLDYRLLPAIAMQESSLCKNIAKNSEHNCWGFGIYGKKRTSFDGFEQAITTVAKTLSEKYAQIGLVDPHQIVTKYNPGSTTWADRVSMFMERIHPSAAFTTSSASASTTADSLTVVQP